MYSIKRTAIFLLHLLPFWLYGQQGWELSYYRPAGEAAEATENRRYFLLQCTTESSSFQVLVPMQFEVSLTSSEESIGGAEWWIYKNCTGQRMWEQARTLQRTQYIVEDSLPTINWQTYPQTRILDGSIKVQRARGQYRGRWYTAWFAPSLPFQHGPWKLGGLPGLILEAYDDDREVVFLFQSLRAVKKLIIKRDVVSGQAIGRQTYLKIKEREFRQFLEYVEARLSSCHQDLNIRLQYSYSFWEDPP